MLQNIILEVLEKEGPIPLTKIGDSIPGIGSNEILDEIRQMFLLGQITLLKDLTNWEIYVSKNLS